MKDLIKAGRIRTYKRTQVDDDIFFDASDSEIDDDICISPLSEQPRLPVEGHVTNTVANGWYESSPLSGSQIAVIEAEIIASEMMCNPTKIGSSRYDTMDHHFHST